nr:hypothetical protein Hi04_10k_c962_00026 [uncultured bacterium]
MSSAKRNARIAGLLYIVGSLFGIVRLIYIPNTLIVHGDAAGTASKIAAHELLFRFGIVTYSPVPFCGFSLRSRSIACSKASITALPCSW